MQKVSFFVQSGHFFARRLGWIEDFYSFDAMPELEARNSQLETRNS
jgi:hypothetical protein